MRLVVLPGGRGNEESPVSQGPRRIVSAASDSAGWGRRCYERLVLTYLDGRMRDFVSRQETVFVTAEVEDGDPEPGVAAGPRGFVRALDEKRLAWPASGQFRGSREVELLFVDLFPDVVKLTVTGTATVGADGWVVVHVGEAALESAKPMPRLLRRRSGGAA